MEFITSANNVYWKKYGHRLADTFSRHAPNGAILILYHEASREGMSGELLVHQGPPDHLVDLFRDVQGLQGFLDKATPRTCERMGLVPSDDPDIRLSQKGYKYIWDAVTFCKKGFALAHALNRSKASKLFWVDADVVFRKPISRKVLEELLDGVGIAYFGRKGQHSETGFIGFDLKASGVKEFALEYQKIWRSEEVLSFRDGWTDCHVFDVALKRARMIGLKARNLSSQSEGHVIATSLFGDYIDHQKGPRKQLGYSPERRP